VYAERERNGEKRLTALFSSGTIRVSQVFSFGGVEMDWDVQCDELRACEDYADWMWFREQERQAALDAEQDICPSCGRIGGEYTPTLDCCAYC
jgi:hypothetical protein